MKHFPNFRETLTEPFADYQYVKTLPVPDGQAIEPLFETEGMYNSRPVICAIIGNISTRLLTYHGTDSDWPAKYDAPLLESYRQSLLKVVGEQSIILVSPTVDLATKAHEADVAFSLSL